LDNVRNAENALQISGQMARFGNEALVGEIRLPCRQPAHEPVRQCLQIGQRISIETSRVMPLRNRAAGSAPEKISLGYSANRNPVENEREFPQPTFSSVA
jgi:hypothetical protein